MSRPAAFTTPYEVIRPTPFQHLAAFAADGHPHDGGVLKAGEVVWTHHALPRVKGHCTALAFIEGAGEVLIEINSLRLKRGAPDAAPHN